MKRGKISSTWYPFFIDKWLFGSTRHELIINESWPEKYPDLVPLVPESIRKAPFADLRGIFQDLLTLSKKDGGFIRANETTPYPLEQLAGMFCVPLDYLKATINICLSERVKKLDQPSPGVYYITSTETYAISDRWKREVTSGNPEVGSGEKERLIKEKKKKSKRIINKYPENFDSEDVRLTELLIELMGKNNPKSSILRRLTPVGKGKWADVCRKLREIDQRTPAEIEAVIRFSQADEFWCTNILSMPTLRDQWDKLVMQSRRSGNSRKETQVGAYRPETARDKENQAKVAAYAKKLWMEAEPELNEARQDREKYQNLVGKKQREIERKLSIFSAELNKAAAVGR